MIRFSGRPIRSCDGFTRRETLAIGGLCALGMPFLEGFSRAGSIDGGNRPGFGSARSCLLIYLFGGPSQLDTFDLKPDAPARIRGEFRPIATSVPGTSICEHMPRLAQRAQRYCLLRSMNHEHPRHGWGLYYMLTGRRHDRPDLDAPPTPNDFPGLGSLITRLGKEKKGVPPAVTLPRWNRFLDLPNDYAGERGGFLGGSFDPWLIQSEGDGLAKLVRGLELPVDLPPGRLSARDELLKRVDRRIGEWGELGQTHDTVYNRAYQVLSSPAVRKALDLRLESDRTRDLYGTHPFGQGLLLARRLIEAGTTFIQLNWHTDSTDVKSPFWDTHKDNFHALSNRLLPPFDIGLAALLDDLESRGLLESTLVVVIGEFGRTPKIGQVVMNGATNATGRDHWPHAYTALLAGGGVRGGRVLGASDRNAAYVTDFPVSPPDLHATILHLCGVDPASVVHDRQGLGHAASPGKSFANAL